MYVSLPPLVKTLFGALAYVHPCAIIVPPGTPKKSQASQAFPWLVRAGLPFSDVRMLSGSRSPGTAGKLPVLPFSPMLAGIESWEDLQRQIRAGGRNFVRYSLPGFDGRPRFGEDRPTAEQFADDAAALVHSPTPFHVMGCSFGAHLALTFAAKYPERVASVLLTGYCSGIKDPKNPEPFIRILIQPVRERAEERIAALRSAGPLRQRQLEWTAKGVTDPPAMAQIARMMRVQSANRCLQAVAARTPLAFVVGREDKVLPCDIQLDVAVKAGAQTCILDRAGYVTFRDAPRSVYKFVRKFWEEAELRLGARDAVAAQALAQPGRRRDQLAASRARSRT